MVEGNEESRESGESDSGQDPTRDESGLQTRTALRTYPAGRVGKSYELGSPEDDEQLYGGHHESTAGLRNPAEHSEAATHSGSYGRGDSSASVGGSRSDVDGSELRRSGGRGEARVCLGSVQSAQVESLEGACAHAPVLAGFLAWRERTPYAKDGDYVFPSFRLKGKKPLSASIMVQKYLRPAAIKAGVIGEDEPVRFGFHNFRHSLASSLVKLKCDPKTVQGILRHEDVRTTMQLYVQSDQESRLEAQGKFLQLLLEDKAHLLTGAVQ